MGTPVTTTLVRRIAAALGIDRPSEWSLAYALASAQLPVGWTALLKEDGDITYVHDRRPQEPQLDHPLLDTAAQALAQVRATPEPDAARGRFLGPFENLDSPALEYFYLDTETGQEVPEHDCPPGQVIPQASEDIRQLLAAAAAPIAEAPADEDGQQQQQPSQSAEDGASNDRGVPSEPASGALAGEDPGPGGTPPAREPSWGSNGAPPSPGAAHTADPGLSGSRPGSARPGSARPESASTSASASAPARRTSARLSSRPGSSAGPSPRPVSAAQGDPYDPSHPETLATTAAAAADNATPMSASGSRPGSGRQAAAGAAAAPVVAAAAARSSSGTGEGRLLGSASSIVAEASRASVAASDVTSASVAAAAAERRRSSSSAASVPAAAAAAYAASRPGRAGSADNGHGGAMSGGAGGSRAGSAVGSSTKRAGDGAGVALGSGNEPSRPSSGASGRSGAGGSERSRAAGSARSGGDGSGGGGGGGVGGRSNGSVRSGAGGEGSGGGGSLRSDSGVSRGPIPPSSGRLTFYGWWFEDVESSDLAFRIDSKPQAGGGLAPRHCTLVYDFNTASYSLTMRDPVTPSAPGQPPDRVPALTVPGISPGRVTRTDTGQPADVWDLHLGARLRVLERPVVLKNSDLATAQWHAGYFRQLAALREKLCQEVQKYKPRVLRPGLVHDKGDVRLQTGQQLRHVAMQVRELIEDLRQYRPIKAESFMAALPVYL